MIAICANKSDLFSKQQVSDDEGKEYSESVGALFQITSAQLGVGINELFLNIGKKLLNMNNKQTNQNIISLNNKEHEEKRKKICCL